MNDVEILADKVIDKVLEISQATGDLVPIISGFANHIRYKRFKKRIDNNEKKIKKIFHSIYESDVDFFAKKIGTMVFEKIMNDQEDDKAEFLILGFENCVENNIKDEDKIIMYFDLLTELRSFDLKRLVTLSRRTGDAPIILIEGSDEQKLIQFSDSKLRRFGFVKTGTSWSTEGGEKIDYGKPIEITNFGNQFLDFIGF